MKIVFKNAKLNVKWILSHMHVFFRVILKMIKVILNILKSLPNYGLDLHS